MSVMTAVVGRQPIVNRQLSVIGYELLFRALTDGTDAYSGPDRPGLADWDGDALTMETLWSARGLGIGRLVGERSIFFNADRGVITGRVPIALDPAQTVVEIVDTVDIDDEIVAGVRRLKSAGFRVALDDFAWSQTADEVLRLVDIVKIDLQLTPILEIPRLIDRCRSFGVQLLAEKVETDAQLTMCHTLGFDLFQGYLLGRPSTVSGPALGPAQHSLLRLVAEVLSPDTEASRIEQIVRLDPALAYRILQLASLGRMGEAGRSIRSIREAIVALGINRLRGWLPALLLRPGGSAVDSSLPTVLTRARMAELFALRLQPADAGFAFTAAMISALDLLLGLQRTELPAALDLPADLKAAAFRTDSPIGRLVQAVVGYQQRDAVAAGLLGIPEDDADNIAAEAFSWALRATDMLDAPVAA